MCRISRNSCFVDNYLWRTPTSNFVKLRLTVQSLIKVHTLTCRRRDSRDLIRKERLNITIALNDGTRQVSKNSSRKSREFKSGTPSSTSPLPSSSITTLHTRTHCCQTKLLHILDDGNFRVSELWQPWWRKKLSALGNMKSFTFYARSNTILFSWRVASLGEPAIRRNIDTGEWTCDVDVRYRNVCMQSVKQVEDEFIQAHRKATWMTETGIWTKASGFIYGLFNWILKTKAYTRISI
jgi:hypothetical protein